MFLRLSTTLFVFAMWTSASFATEEVEFSRHLIGCWQHGAIPQFTGKPDEVFMTQVCFEGATEGKAVHFTCHGFGILDCWETVESYTLLDSKLRFVSNDGAEQICDAQVVPERTLHLYGCEGEKASFSERTYIWIDQP